MVLFEANDGVHGFELWTTDGTESGTRLVTDIRPGPTSTGMDGGIRYGDAVYFLANDTGYVANLWRSDGTAAGTYRIADLGDAYTPLPMAVHDGALWFISFDAYGPGKIWRSDGTAAGTAPTVDLGFSIYDAWNLVSAGDKLFFVAFHESAGYELFVTDGTTAGTHMTRDIDPGYTFSTPEPFKAVGNTLYFLGIEQEHGPEIWKSDGTEAGTVLVKDIFPGPRYVDPPSVVATIGDVLLIAANDGEHGYELWRSDGTEAGTVMLDELLPGAEGSAPRAFSAFGSRLVFSAVNDVTGREPWITHGAVLTRQPVQALRDLAGDVHALGLPAGIELGLVTKLDAAVAALDRPDGVKVARSYLGAFSRAVESHSPQPISASAAADLLEFTGEIEELLGADGAPRPVRPIAEPAWTKGQVTLGRPR